ncbi:hypothetical protein Afil01_19610 [Actinorhabdospora filicis]|uniref:Uncharacterized protein n=1 Tax=Actinorhabdospora filicis TaxID=1785913 RepID=A0A9W6SK72_9ACTN|nr:hypothetical protein [Actinorhabdospora filicis]GLZ77154.1 hypothetical protein Afil01_19610 [Actinorhabdospora filicis]
MGKRFYIQGVEFDLDTITYAHFSRGLTGGILDVLTSDGGDHTFQLWTRDVADDFYAYAILKYECEHYTESFPKGYGGS